MDGRRSVRFDMDLGNTAEGGAVRRAHGPGLRPINGRDGPVQAA
jgi:hypothetical protein